MGTAWDISGGMYASKSLSVTSQDATPRDVAFSADGTKAYIMGLTNKRVYQYTLSTAWDISTGSYASKSMSVSAQDGTPRSVAFSADGTKCYVTGFGVKKIFQYTLSTAWDISTGSYASKFLLVSGEDSSPYGIAFSADGTKCYMTGGTNKTVYQYTLSTAWDISTGSYASKSLLVSSQDSQPFGVALSSDGTKYYMMGFNTDTIYQYTLSTAWDISTGSYASKSLSVTSEDASPINVAFSADGTKCYMVGLVNDTVYQYTLATGGVSGTGAVSLGALVTAGSGTVTTKISGTGTVTLGALTVSGTGTVSGSVSGTGTVSLGALVVSGTGTVSGSVSGTGSVPLGALVTSGTGTASGTAWEYTPPTETVSFRWPSERRRSERGRGPEIGGQVISIQRGRAVLLNSGVYSLSSGPTVAQLAAADAYYLGGHVATVDTATKDAIEASGVGGTFVLI